MAIVARLLKYLFTLEALQGYRTYLAMAGAIGLALYSLSQGDYEKAVTAFVAFLGLVGLKTPTDPPASGDVKVKGFAAALLLAVGLLALPAAAAAQGPTATILPLYQPGDGRGPDWFLPPQQPVILDDTPWPADGVEQHAKQIGAPAAWAKGFAGKGQVVAVLDTGCDTGHPQLKDFVVKSVDLTRSRSGPADVNGHGTWCMSGVKSIAPDAKGISVKVLGDSGSGTDNDIGAGVDWAVENGATVISLSIGSSQPGPYSGPAIARAIEKGVTVVAAAGNSGPGMNTIGYPGALPGVVCVAAVDSGNAVARFSSRGARLDIAAPGVNVSGAAPGGGRVKMSGTSMATPLVAGSVACVRSANQAGGAAVEKLFMSADDLPPTGRDTDTGRGLARPDKATVGLAPVDPAPVPMPPGPTPVPGNVTLTRADLNDAGLAKLKAAGLSDFRMDLTWLKAYTAAPAQVVPPAQASPVLPAPVWQPFPVFFGGGCPNGQCPLQR